MSQAKSQEDASTHLRILVIAAQHVRRHGAARTTVVSVAREARMTHANIYRYFPSKQALLDAVVADWLRGVERLLGEVAEAPDPADDKAERLILALAKAQRDGLESDPNLFDLMAEAFQETRGVARKNRARVRMLVDRVIEEGIGSGVFQIRNAEKAGTLLLDSAFRFVHPIPVRLDAGLSRRVVDARLAMVLKAAIRALKSGAV